LSPCAKSGGTDKTTSKALNAKVAAPRGILAAVALDSGAKLLLEGSYERTLDQKRLQNEVLASETGPKVPLTKATPGFCTEI
jgi:hypothetical protein